MEELHTHFGVAYKAVGDVLSALYTMQMDYFDDGEASTSELIKDAVAWIDVDEKNEPRYANLWASHKGWPGKCPKRKMHFRTNFSAE